MLWRDGRMIRATAIPAVGKVYLEGRVGPQQREGFFRFLSTAVARAPKSVGIPLHAATQSITIRDGANSEWIRILPDTESVWREIESRMFALPLLQAHAVTSDIADSRALGSVR